MELGPAGREAAAHDAAHCTSRGWLPPELTRSAHQARALRCLCLGQGSWAYARLTLPLCKMGSKRTLPCTVARQITHDSSEAALGQSAEGRVWGTDREGEPWPRPRADPPTNGRQNVTNTASDARDCRPRDQERGPKGHEATREEASGAKGRRLDLLPPVRATPGLQRLQGRVDRKRRPNNHREAGHLLQGEEDTPDL